eukprot:CAMPEP_0195518362 /NCGR_PEP_ID=MMETSP0794_2-20130614/12717_1 /TAXON_ID=515487 /ORGANISM="Stephanopyxis turris, Strain CCMP 815" /LENGTH=132 /DNA_ID=CAMNT_0040647311 /DNA_START=110 /DNA_END=508 /DNA_ORIENTATION=-
MATVATAQPVQAVEMTPQQYPQQHPQQYQVAQPVHQQVTVVHQHQIMVGVDGGPSLQAINHQTCSIVVFIVGFFIPLVFWGGTCLMCQPDKTPLARGLNIASIVLAVLVTIAIILAIMWPLYFVAILVSAAA